MIISSDSGFTLWSILKRSPRARFLLPSQIFKDDISAIVFSAKLSGDTHSTSIGTLKIRFGCKLISITHTSALTEMGAESAKKLSGMK
jgi:hypothetical protein